MDRLVIKNKKNQMVIFILSIVIYIGIASFLIGSTYNRSVEKKYTVEDAKILNYSLKGNKIVSTSSDGQLIFPSKSIYLSSLNINFAQKLENDTNITIYYDSGNGFMSDQLISFPISKGSLHTNTIFINSNVEGIRIDIGDKEGQEFKIKNIVINGDKTELNKVLVKKIFIFTFLWVIVLFYLILYKKSNTEKMNSIFTTKRIVIAAIILFLIMVIFKINVSNMAMYKSYLPGNVALSNTLTIGTPRAIRSDEWLVNVSNSLHLHSSGEKGNIFVWISTYIIPYNWGYLFLPLAYAFSFASLSSYLMLFLAGFFTLKIFVKDNNTFALVSSFLILFSPAVAWWNATRTFGEPLAIIACFYYFFHMKEKKYKVICAIGLAIFLPSFMLQQYPAWQVPLIYFSIFIIIGAFRQFKNFRLTRTDFWYIIPVVIFVGMVMVCFFYGSSEYIKSISATVYPGKRFEVGGNLTYDYFGNYLTSFLSSFKELNFSNNSEASSFITLFPVPIIIYFIKRKEFKEYKILTAIINFIFLCLIYMCIGFIPLMSKYSFMSNVTTQRLFTIFEFALFFLLLLELYYIKEVKGIKNLFVYLKREAALLNLSIFIFLYYIFMKQKFVVAYMGIKYFIVISIMVVTLSNLLILGKKKLLLSIMFITILVSGVSVNPINFGIGIMDNTPLAKKIVTLDKKDSGKWITTDELVLSKYVNAQGVDCLNAVSFPPKFDLFYPIDKTRKYKDVYNRYAHIVVRLSEEEKSSFELITGDSFFANLSIHDIDEWKIKYILTRNSLNINTDELYSRCIYNDKADGVRIYKINYK